MSIYTLKDIEENYLSYGLKKLENFNSQILEEVKNLSYDIDEKDFPNYEDHTHEKVVTIDGQNTRDIDDAVLVKRCGKSYVLTVYISDVSHFVTEGSYLDKEALKRGTSIYLPHKTLSMLPLKLSNDICSLKENKKRLTLAISMKFSKKGKLKEKRIFKAIISSKKKMTYENVNEVLNNGKKTDKAILKEYKSFISDIYLMKELALILRKRRKKKGFIELDIPEFEFYVPSSHEFDNIDITPYERNIAHIIIEEFMLSANMAIDEHFCEIGIPLIHRIHPMPLFEKLNFKLDVNYEDLTSDDTSYLVKVISNHIKHSNGIDKIVLSHNILNSLVCAKYSHLPEGHFALNTKYYCHFTSPIRRYPDLFIHRIISKYIDHNLTKEDIEHYKSIIEQVAMKCSDTESFAKKVSRELENMYIAYFMQDFIGKDFKASVYNISRNNISIVLDNLFFNGKIRCTTINSLSQKESLFINGELIIDKQNIIKKHSRLIVTLVDIDTSTSTLLFELSNKKY